MHWKETLSSWLRPAWQFLRRSPTALPIAVTLACVVTLLAQLLDCHTASLPELPTSPADIPTGFLAPHILAHLYFYLAPYLDLMMALGLVLWLLCLAIRWPSVAGMAMPTFLLGGGIAFWLIADDVHDKWTLESLSVMGEPASWTTYIIKLVLLFLLLTTPSLMLRWYGGLKTLDRYVLRSFLQPLLFCLIAFASLLVIMDLLGNLKDFQEAGTPMSAIAGFYLSFVPYMYVSVLSAALLLSVLFTLSKMSRANEIVAMLTAGRSLQEVLRPILIASAYATLVSMAVNYYWGPRGEGQRAAVMRAMTDKRKGAAAMTGVMHRNEETRRTWFIGSVPYELRGNKMSNVEVRQFDSKGRLQHGWYARSAKWWPGIKMWTFYNGIDVGYRNGIATGEFSSYTNKESYKGDRIEVFRWSETPWSIISGSLLPDVLSVPELDAYLTANHDRAEIKLAPFRTQLWQRFALPLQGLVMVFVAAPLGVAFSRRGSLGGIAGAVLMFFGLMFLNEFFLGLGKSTRMAPWLAVWMPHLIFGLIGTVLLWSKSQNKELPKLSLKTLSRWLRPPAPPRRSAA